MHRCKSSNVSRSRFVLRVSEINIPRHSNIYFNKPVPLTCNISEGVHPRSPYTLSPRGTFSKALIKSFLQRFLNPSSVKRACCNSSNVISEHDGMGLESSSNRHLQSRYKYLGKPPLTCPTRLLCPKVSPAIKCIHTLTRTRRPITVVQKPPSS